MKLRVWATRLATLLIATPLLAFPPAPHHTLFGLVRDQWGDPFNVTGAEVFIHTASAVGVMVNVAASTEPGVNYRMRVPMDSGRTLDLYQTTALYENQPFQLKVQVGATTYIPLEMALNSRALGQPAGSTRLDLTLGVDADGDGLPDAWEQALLELLGGDLASITPEGDADGDGLNNLQEFLAGTHPFDPSEGLRLALTRLSPEGNSTLEFFTVRSRTYRLEVSSDLRQWSPTPFRIVHQGIPGPLQTEYLATDYRQIQIEVPFQTGAETNRHFRALAQ